MVLPQSLEMQPEESQVLLQDVRPHLLYTGFTGEAVMYDSSPNPFLNSTANCGADRFYA